MSYYSYSLLAYGAVISGGKMSIKKKLSLRKKATQGRAQVTVNSILQATTHIIEKSGLDQLSTNHIAKKAGVSIGSLYQYFPSKESILIQLVEKELNGHVENLKQHIDQIDDSNLPDFVDEILETILVMFEKKKKIRYLLYKFLPRGLTPMIHDIEDELQKIVYKKLKTFPELEDKENLKLVSYIIVHSVIGVVHSNLAKGRNNNHKLISIELKIMINSYLAT